MIASAALPAPPWFPFFFDRPSPRSRHSPANGPSYSRDARPSPNAAAPTTTVSIAELQAGYLERCLRLWGAWERIFRAGPKPVRVALWAGQRGISARADGTATDHLCVSDRWVATNVSKAVEALPVQAHRLTLEVEYVLNGNGPMVWTNNRLPRDPEQLAALLAAAKVELIPILRRRGLPV